MSRRGIFRGLPLAGGAAAGVLFGHILTYLVAYPGGAQRTEVLAQSGHGYWPNAVTFVIQAAVAVSTLVAVRTLRERTASFGGERRVLPLFGWLTLQLSLRQIVGFAGLEVIERLATHVPLSELLTHDLVPIALAAQIMVAAVIAAVLLLVSRTAALLAVSRARRSPGLSTSWPRSAQLAGPIPVPVLAGGRGLRSPPLSLLPTI